MKLEKDLYYAILYSNKNISKIGSIFLLNENSCSN